MKIAFIASDNNASSGAFLSMANLAKQLNSQGIETIIFLPPNGAFVGPGDGENLLKEMGLKYVLIPSYTWIVPQHAKHKLLISLGQIRCYFRNIFSAKKLAKQLIQQNIDIVHINTSYSYFGALAAKYANLPFIWHIREFLEEDQGNRFFCKPFAYRLLNQANLVIAISNSIYDKYKSIITHTDLKVIYNGIDIEKFYMPDRKIFTSDHLKLLYTGGLSYLKGTDDIIDACIELNLAGYKNNYTLTIAGRGEPSYEEELIQKIKDNQLSNIRFLGYQKDIADIMQDADVSIIPSRFEAFGRVTVESMLTGNLILGADSAGTKELLQNGKYGLLYQCGNPHDIKEKVIYILNHKQILSECAIAGKCYMAENMTSEKNATEIYEQYKRILQGTYPHA